MKLNDTVLSKAQDQSPGKTDFSKIVKGKTVKMSKKLAKKQEEIKQQK